MNQVFLCLKLLKLPCTLLIVGQPGTHIALAPVDCSMWKTWLHLLLMRSLFSICFFFGGNLLFLFRSLKYFLFFFKVLWFHYNVSKYRFVSIYPSGNLACFLNMRIHVFFFNSWKLLLLYLNMSPLPPSLLPPLENPADFGCHSLFCLPCLLTLFS